MRASKDETFEGDEPVGPLTRAAEAGLEGVAAYADEHGIELTRVLVLTENDIGGGTGYFDSSGDADPSEVVVMLLYHTRAVLRSMGQDMDVVPIQKKGQG